MPSRGQKRQAQRSTPLVEVDNKRFRRLRWRATLSEMLHLWQSVQIKEPMVSSSKAIGEAKKINRPTLPPRCPLGMMTEEEFFFATSGRF